MPNRGDDLSSFYRILEQLKQKMNGPLLLSGCSGRMSWPARGVYFFMEPGEVRKDSGTGLRIVRVGTHALNLGSTATLWRRLSQHKGSGRSGGGNHRGSIFRRLLGTTLDEYQTCPTWGHRGVSTSDARLAESVLERQVSSIIRRMPFLYLPIDDAPGPQSFRGNVERNSIALLSNFDKPPLDPASPNWRGHRCNRPRVSRSGLWNQNHVDDIYDPTFLYGLEELVDAVKPTA